MLVSFYPPNWLTSVVLIMCFIVLASRLGTIATVSDLSQTLHVYLSTQFLLSCLSISHAVTHVTEHMELIVLFAFNIMNQVVINSHLPCKPTGDVRNLIVTFQKSPR
jgi:hypothetical protein